MEQGDTEKERGRRYATIGSFNKLGGKEMKSRQEPLEGSSPANTQ